MSHLANIKITLSNLRSCTVNKILHVPLKQFALLGRRLNYDTWNWRWKRKLKYCVLFCSKLDVSVWIFQGIWGGTNCGKVTNFANLWQSFFFLCEWQQSERITRTLATNLKYHNQFQMCSVLCEGPDHKTNQQYLYCISFSEHFDSLCDYLVRMRKSGLVPSVMMVNEVWKSIMGYLAYYLLWRLETIPIFMHTSCD